MFRISIAMFRQCPTHTQEAQTELEKQQYAETVFFLSTHQYSKKVAALKYIHISSIFYMYNMLKIFNLKSFDILRLPNVHRQCYEVQNCTQYREY